MHPSGIRAVFAEFLGSTALAVVVIGSGIAAQRLSPDDTGLALLENAAATAGGLFVLITVLMPVSGAHFNPIVSLLDGVLGHRRWLDVAAYLPAQVVGCIAGAMVANVMFGLPALQLSSTERLSAGTFLSEVLATAGLAVVIFVLARTGRSRYVAPAVACYIGAGYFFTSSTSFANPAVTVGRVFTDTFAGIAPHSALAFVVAQLLGGALALIVLRVLAPKNIAAAPSR